MRGAVRYLSVCSGIEAASVAWHPLGWSPVAFSEIEAFPSAVLAHHYPDVPNLGDMTKFKDWPDAAIDLLVGGTPCQSFSVAGLRKGMADPRGNLALTYLAIADRYRPEWVVWENVPGVLSSSGGRDFGAFVGGLGELGYGWAYRTVDAQYVRVDGFDRAVPQRRRRVFVVGNLRSWRRAAAVLFEPESLSGNPAPSRQAGERPAPTISSRPTGGGGLGTDFDCDGGLIAFGGNNTSGSIDVATACQAQGGPHGRLSFDAETFLGAPGIAKTLTRGAESAGKGGYVGRRQEDDDNLIAFDARQSDVIQYGNMTGPLDTDGHTMAVAFTQNQSGDVLTGDVMHSLGTNQNATGRNAINVSTGWAVRRLTPTECERLQGFPEIVDRVRIEVWHSSDRRAIGALAATQSLRSQLSASSVEDPASPRHADTAAADLRTDPLSHDLPVVLHVLMNCERQAVEIRRAGKSIWSASIAERPSASPLHMPLDAFARLVALTAQTVVPQTLHGRVELPRSINGSSPALLGSRCVAVSGQEIEELAADAASFTTAMESSTKSTTSRSGLDSPRFGSIQRTLSSCVIAAISSCIPSETRSASSYAVTLEATRGYTAITYRGKPAADGPRYKALGNSMAVNCMRWIGRRIELVRELLEQQEAA